ncbi:MAG: T9SS type A sorting domain-containing protein [Bacteroidales bacterium]
MKKLILLLLMISSLSSFGQLTVSATSPPVCYNDSNGTATATPSGGTGPYTYLWSTTPPQTTQTATHLPAGTYTVTVTDDASNTATAITSLTVNPLPVPTITGPNPVCAGTTGNVYCTQSGMTGYAWTVSSGGTITAGGADCITVTWNTPGAETVNVNYIDINGCTDTIVTVYNVTVDPLPVAPLALSGDTNNFCSGTGPTITLTAIGGSGTVLNWFVSCGGASIGTGTIITTPAPAITTTYYASWANACGISGCDSATIIVNSLPTPTITGSSSICAGQTTTLDAGGGYFSYSWSTAATTQTINVATTGYYTVTVMNNYGCTATTMKLVTVDPGPVPYIAGPIIICSGDTAALYETTDYSTYSWSTASTTQAIYVTTSGTYIVTVTDSTGCSASTDVYVNVVPSLTPIITGNTAVCSGNATTLEAGAGFATYAWSTGAISDTISAALAGEYKVTVTDGQGCSGEDSIIVIVNPLPVPSITGPTQACTGSAGNIYVTQAGMTAYNWTVSPGGTLLAGGMDSAVVTWNNGGTNTICVNYTDANGCTALSATCYNVSIDSLISAAFTLSPDTTTPHHYIVTNEAAGIPPLSYLWGWGDGTYDSIAYPTHTYASSGNYTICLTVTDSVGCTNEYCDSSYLSKSPNSIISVTVVHGTNGIKENKLLNQIKVYPNPAFNNLTIETPQLGVIEITNIQGQLINTYTATGNKTIIDVSAFPCGVYVVEVRTEKGVEVRKFIKE